MFVDGAVTLICAERPTIGEVTLLGREVWLGWPMLAALAADVLFGRIKLRYARELPTRGRRCAADARPAGPPRAAYSA